MKIIDAHIHLFEKPYSDVYDNSHIKNGADGEVSLFEEYRKKHNVESAFVVCHEDRHCPDNNAFIEKLGKERKWIYSFASIKAEAETFADQASAMLSKGHFGLSSYLKSGDSGSWLCSAKLDKLWDTLQKFNIPISLGVDSDQCAALCELLEKHIKLTVLINHMGRPRLLRRGGLDNGAYKGVLRLASFANVYIKLSAFYAFSPKSWDYPHADLFCVLKALKREFGGDRLLFASDFSPVLEFNTYRQTIEMLEEPGTGFESSELEQIYFLNSKRIIDGRMRDN